MAEASNQPHESLQSVVLRGPNQTSRYADITALSSRFAGLINEIIESLGEITIVVKREGLLELLTYLRDEPRLYFNFLSDVSGIEVIRNRKTWCNKLAQINS